MDGNPTETPLPELRERRGGRIVAATTEILSSVLTKEPEWDRVPTKLRRLLRTCLEKDPKHRLRDIGDVWQLLEQPGVAQSSTPSKLPWAVAAVFALGAALLAFLYLARTKEELYAYRLSRLISNARALGRRSEDEIAFC
jgi:hypothetical protein